MSQNPLKMILLVGASLGLSVALELSVGPGVSPGMRDCPSYAHGIGDDVSLLQMQQQVLKRSKSSVQGLQEPQLAHDLIDLQFPLLAEQHGPLFGGTGALDLTKTLDGVNAMPSMGDSVSMLEKGRASPQADVLAIQEQLTELMALNAERSKQTETMAMVALNAKLTDAKVLPRGQEAEHANMNLMYDYSWQYSQGSSGYVDILAYGIFFGAAGLCFCVFCAHQGRRRDNFADAERTGRYIASVGEETRELGNTLGDELGKFPFAVLGAMELSCIAFFLLLALLWSKGFVQGYGSHFILIGLVFGLLIFVFCSLQVCQSSVRVMHAKYDIRGL